MPMLATISSLHARLADTSTTSVQSDQKVVITEEGRIAEKDGQMGDGEPPVGGIDICLF